MRLITVGVIWGVYGSILISGTRAAPVSPYLIGENSFNADTPGQDADRVWGKMKEARFKLIRLGGISNNDKTPSVETHARWIDSIRSIGAEPLVQVSSIDPPATAANLVKALNIDRKYGIKFWSIGNEPTCVTKTDGTITARIAANVKERALAMKAVDPTIKILFGDECYWKPDLYGPLIGGANDVTGDGMIAGKNVRYVDGVTFHTYPLPGSSKTDVYTRNDVVFGATANVRGQFQNCRKAADAADAAHGRTGADKLSISLTEFNVTYWNSSDNTPAGVGVRSFVAGQFVAEVFGMGLEYGALTVAPWSMLESGGDGRGGDLGLFDGTGGIVPRPAYHHIKMIADNMAGDFLGVTVEKADLVRAFGTQNGDEAAVLILNENQTAGFRFILKFNAAASAGATLRALTGWDGEVTDSIPAQSTLLLKVRKPGVVQVRTFYSLDQAAKYLPPTMKEFPLAIKAPGRSHGAASAVDGPFQIRSGRGEIGGDLVSVGPYQAAAYLGGSYEVVLMDCAGAVVTAKAGRGTSWSLPVSGLKMGSYVLSLKTGERIRARKVVLNSDP